MGCSAYAPVVIVTLNRYTHLKQCIDSLARNPLATKTDLFISVDYPPGDKYVGGYKKVVDLVDAIDPAEFNSVNIIKRESNLGAQENSRRTQWEVFESYDRLIFSEDDNVFSPCFLDYMNQCLDEYSSEDSIAFINGYSYPVFENGMGSDGIIAHTYLCSAWGIGLWRDKEKLIQDRLNSGWLFRQFDDAVNSKLLGKMSLNRRCEYVIACMTGLDRGFVSCTSDVSRGIYTALGKCYTLTPRISKVRNMGFDGSGENCSNILNGKGLDSQSYNYSLQETDDKSRYSGGVSLDYDDAGSYKARLDGFLKVNFTTRVLASILLQIYRIFGSHGQLICRKFFNVMPFRGKRIDDGCFL